MDADAPKASSGLIFGTGAGKFLHVRNSSNATMLSVQDATGNVGIGTANPAFLLTVGSSSVRGTLDVIGSTTVIPYVSLTDSRSGGHQYTLYGGVSGPGSFDIFDQFVGVTRFTIYPNGRVGIGQYFAPAGEENLRIIRGVVGPTGAIIAGSGFTVSHDASGEYTITFNTAFSLTAPTVTATAEVIHISLNGVTAFKAKFHIYNLGGQDSDSAFHFIAIGPR